MQVGRSPGKQAAGGQQLEVGGARHGGTGLDHAGQLEQALLQLHENERVPVDAGTNREAGEGLGRHG